MRRIKKLRAVAEFVILYVFLASRLPVYGAAPTVNAGPAKTISFPAKDITLFGHATSTVPLILQWTQTAGPAQAHFSAPWAEATTVTFTVSGNYTFQLSASDGTSTVTSSTTVTVNPESSQTAFYVDPTYTGATSDGSAAHPWKSLSLSATDPAWTAINSALASNDVIVYFSARQATTDIPEVITTEVNLWRTDISTHRFTVDGMSKYNTNDAVPAWANNTGTNKFNIKILSGSISIGVQSDQYAYPANYTTIRGFDVSGASGRLMWAGNYSVIEYIHSHDVTAIGATVQFSPAVKGYPDCTIAWGNLKDISVRNNLIERGQGEAIYIAGTYIKTTDGGCPSWGNTHSNILVENNVVNYPAQNGGEGDGVDLKAGLTNVTVRGNVINHNTAYYGQCIVSLGVFNSSTVNANYLFEQNICNDTGNIVGSNWNQVVIRNNVLYGAKAYIGSSGDGTSVINYNVRISNNTISGGSIGSGDTNGFILRNNNISGLSCPTSQQLSKYDSLNIDSDYNVLEAGCPIDSAFADTHSVFVGSTTSQFAGSSTGDFHLVAGGPGVGVGANLTSTGFNVDHDNVLRPTSAAWDIGAYQLVTISATAPAITTQPGPQTIASGATANLSVVVSGAVPLTYQWYQGTSGNTSSPVGGNSSSFLTPALSTTTSYWLRVTNAAGSADSATATITVTSAVAPAITTQPLSQSIASGTTATLSVLASGTAPLTFQWYQGLSGNTSVPVGTNASSYATRALTTTTNYWVQLTNSAGSVNSATATITVGSAPTIAAQPVSQTIISGATTNLSVVASGPVPLSYQWYQGTTADTTTPVGTNSSSFTTPTLTTTSSYWVQVTNSAGSTNSATATITVNAGTAPVVSISSPSSGATVSGAVSISADVSGGSITGVQFVVDNVNLGPQITTPPYTALWNTSGVSNAPHTLTAIAWNSANLQGTGPVITVTVNNAAPTQNFSIPAGGGVSFETVP